MWWVWWRLVGGKTVSKRSSRKKMVAWKDVTIRSVQLVVNRWRQKISKGKEEIKMVDHHICLSKRINLKGILLKGGWKITPFHCFLIQHQSKSCHEAQQSEYLELYLQNWKKFSVFITSVLFWSSIWCRQETLQATAKLHNTLKNTCRCKEDILQGRGAYKYASGDW